MSSDAIRPGYETYDKKYNTPHNRSCIDGTKTSSSECVAYCYCDAHPGFLTESLRAEHQCLERDCTFYLPKPIKPRIKTSYLSELHKVLEDIDNTGDSIKSLAISGTSDMDGLLIKRVAQENNGSWKIYYVAIADYALDTVAQRISEHIGASVTFSKLDYDFEKAANAVFG